MNPLRLLSGAPRPAEPTTSTTVKMLTALSGMQVYGGTVPAKVVARRRAANKVARASRRANRTR